MQQIQAYCARFNISMPTMLASSTRAGITLQKIKKTLKRAPHHRNQCTNSQCIDDSTSGWQSLAIIAPNTHQIIVYRHVLIMNQDTPTPPTNWATI